MLRWFLEHQAKKYNIFENLPGRRPFLEGLLFYCGFGNLGDWTKIALGVSFGAETDESEKKTWRQTRLTSFETTFC